MKGLTNLRNGSMGKIRKKGQQVKMICWTMMTKCWNGMMKELLKKKKRIGGDEICSGYCSRAPIVRRERLALSIFPNPSLPVNKLTVNCFDTRQPPLSLSHKHQMGFSSLRNWTWKNVLLLCCAALRQLFGCLLITRNGGARL